MSFESGRPAEKMTEDIKQFIISLLKENIKLKAPQIQNKIRDYLIEKKSKDREYIVEQNRKAKGYSYKEIDLNVAVEAELPGQSSITKYIKPLKPKLRQLAKNPKEIDTTWSIGDCIKYNIPAEMIPLLVKVQFEPDMLTVRQARWLCKLYPALAPLIKEALSELEPINQLGRVVFIADQYARQEEIAEIIGARLDTSELDNRYFRQKNFTAKGIFTGFLESEIPPDKLRQIQQWSAEIKEARAKGELAEWLERNPEAKEYLARGMQITELKKRESEK